MCKLLMLPLAVLAASLSLSSATLGTNRVSVSQCVQRCERHNDCRTSLDSLSCEASCQAVCKCSAISRRMLNKPKHCMSSMLEEHHRRLAMFQQSHPRMKKVVLKDDQPKFNSFVPLEDFWPHGHHDQTAEETQDESKPRMLNSHAHLAMLNRKSRLSLINKESMPWSPEGRSLGTWSKAGHRHRHHHGTAFLDKHTNATKPEKQANVTKATTAPREMPVKKVTANTTNASTVATQVKAAAAKVPSNASAASSNTTTPSKVVTGTKNTTSSNATTPAKVAASSKSPKTAALTNTTSAKEPVKKK